MKTIIRIFALFCVVGIQQEGLAQKVSNKGKEFWVGYGHHQYMETGSNTQNMVLYLSAEEAAVVTVTIDSSSLIPATWFRKTYNIPANTVITTENLPKGTINAAASGSNPNYDARLYSDPPPSSNGGEQLFRRKGIHIESNVPIVAYAHIFGSVSSGATMLLPVETWGLKYTSLNSEQVDAGGPGYSWIYVIAKENNTVIKITPAVNTRLNKPAGVPFNVSLQKGQIYQMIGQSNTSGTGNQFSGSTVESIPGPDGKCHPVAAFAGSSRTRGESVPCGSSSGRDNDMQQMFPEHSWGQRYATAPFSTSSGSTTNPTLNASTFQTSVYKIAVSDPTTVVRKNGTILTGLILGKYYQYSSNTADYIQADKPIMVAQFMSGSSTCNPGSHGDPDMVFLSPLEQSIKRAGFFRNTEESIYSNYVTIIVPTPGLATLKVDNSGVFNHTYAHPNLPGYSVAIKGWASAKAQATISCDYGFVALTYGLGGAESYTFSAGANFDPLKAVVGITNSPTINDSLAPFNCTGTPVKLSVLMLYQPGALDVAVDSLPASVVTPNNRVSLNPASNAYQGIVVVNGVTYFKYDLPGTYMFHNVGTYYIPVTATNPAASGCLSIDTFRIEVVIKQQPTLTFNEIAPPNPTYCDSIEFVTNATGFTKFAWEFPAGTPHADSSSTTKFLFPGPGTYINQLKAFTPESCVTQPVTRPLTLGGPVINIGVAPTSTCISNGVVNITPDNTTATEWYWDFGDGTGDTLFSNAPFTHTYTQPGTYTITHSLSIGSACKPAATPVTVTIYAEPNTTFTFPAGCLPANGVVQFQSNASASDGQAIASHAWNFGDPASGANNTSTLANPTHNYTTATYTLTYRATTANGCTKDTSVTTTFNVTPTVQFSPVAPVCGNVAPIDLAPNVSVTNSVPGSGVFKGNGVSAAGLFNPVAAGQGSHTIWYVFTSTGNCLDSQSQSITVNPVPNASFTFPTGCLTNSTIQFNNTSTPAAGPGVTYGWDFGDGGTSTVASPAHPFAAQGPYNVKLTVTSSGCTDDTTMAVTVQVQPMLSYPALTGVCASVAPFPVGNGTVTNGLSGGTFTHGGPGITNATLGTFDPAVAGIGSHTFWSIYTSPDGCKDSTPRTISVGPGPTASFTYPTTCLTSSNVQFTSNSTIPTGTTPSYLWDFGDPASGANNTSTIASPVHTYPSDGTYNVKLTVTVSGCADDTTIAVPVKIQPVIVFPVQPDVCANVPAYNLDAATITNGVTGTGTYTGNGITNGSTGTFDPSVAGVGTHSITYTFASALGRTATAQRNVIVKAIPFASFTTPTTCLPDGNVQFTNTSTGATSYVWDFGDATPASTATAPLHLFSGSGPYSVKLTATSNGCSKDTTIPVTVRVQPVINFPVQADVCANVPAYNLAAATITNGVTGTGTYTGNGITNAATGTFNPSVAGVGTHSITYTFTSALGCTATAQRNVIVKSIPFASFTTPTTCLPNGNVQFTNTSTGATSYVWDFGDATPASTATAPLHLFSGSGPYNVKLTATSNGCSKDTTIPVTVRVQPVINFPVQADVCANVPAYNLAAATITNGVTGTGTYTGNGITNAATGTFNPSVAGVGTHSITYTFTSALGCTATAQRNVIVKAIPFASFTTPTTCLPNGNVQFTNTSTGATSYVWDFGDATPSSTAPAPLHMFSGSGPYNVKLTATSNGCSKDTTIPVTVRVQPVINFPVQADVCANVPAYNLAAATITNGVTGTGTYTGNGITNAATGTFDPSVAGVGTHSITYTFTSALGCTATAQRNVIVKLIPVASFTYPTGCLNNGLVQFTNTSTPVAGATYMWNFGDPTSTSNTSTLASPTHNYNTFGVFNIKLTTTVNNCSHDTTIAATFALKAQLAYPALTPVCHDADIVSVATATVTNGVPGTGIYKGNGVDSLGNFNPKLVGSGPQTITYEYMTTLGSCVTTITSSIMVNPKPTALFTLTQNPCVNANTTFTNTSTVSSGTITTMRWNIGGVDTVTTSGAPFNRTFSSEGAYDVRLIVVSNNGCTDTAIQTINVKPLPVAYFTLPGNGGVCMPNGNAQFTNETTISDNDSLKYVWNFGDGSATSTAVNPSHIYNSTNDSAFVKLTATSNYGCTDDTTRAILFYKKPYANFSADQDTLCQGRPVQFIDLSVPQGDPIATYSWNFGDGESVSVETNPLKTYRLPGDYQIKLTVTSENGCQEIIPRNIRVNLQPVIDAGPSFRVHVGESVTFNPVINSPNITFKWTPETGLNNSQAIRPSLVVRQDQTYKLTATGPGGCTASDSLTVKIMRPINVPNAFSPNGDGINDVWDLRNLQDYPQSVVEVFSRYGRPVYTVYGQTKSWDGTSNGKPLPVGTYYYVIDLKDGSKPFTGYVVLLK